MDGFDSVGATRLAGAIRSMLFLRDVSFGVPLDGSGVLFGDVGEVFDLFDGAKTIRCSAPRNIASGRQDRSIFHSWCSRAAVPYRA